MGDCLFFFFRYFVRISGIQGFWSSVPGPQARNPRKQIASSPYQSERASMLKAWSREWLAHLLFFFEGAEVTWMQSFTEAVLLELIEYSTDFGAESLLGSSHKTKRDVFEQLQRLYLGKNRRLLELGGRTTQATIDWASHGHYRLVCDASKQSPHLHRLTCVHLDNLTFNIDPAQMDGDEPPYVLEKNYSCFHAMIKTGVNSHFPCASFVPKLKRTLKQNLSDQSQMWQLACLSMKRSCQASPSTPTAQPAPVAVAEAAPVRTELEEQDAPE